MNYLKTFESYDDESTKLDILDILSELKDLGYKVDISDIYINRDMYSINIRDNIRPSEWIQLPWNEIKEYLLRVKDYLGNRYLNFEYTGYTKRQSDDSGLLNKVELNNETQIDNYVYKYTIYFY